MPHSKLITLHSRVEKGGAPPFGSRREKFIRGMGWYCQTVPDVLVAIAYTSAGLAV